VGNGSHLTPNPFSQPTNSFEALRDLNCVWEDCLEAKWKDAFELRQPPVAFDTKAWLSQMKGECGTREG
jgi:hypothetical protein